MKVLVTGGAGFIGKMVVNSIIKEGHTVVVIDNLHSGVYENVNPKATFYEIDVCSNKLEEIFYYEKPDTVIHLAAQVSVSKSIESPAFDANTNILGTINTLECCVKSAVRKIVYSSSAAVYGNPVYLGIDEKHPVNPISFYGLSKLVAEEYVKLYSKRYNLKYTIFRLANVFGYSNKISGEDGVVYQFLNSIMDHKQPVIFGDGNQTRDLIYVKDIAAACTIALNDGDNETLNLGTGTQTSINQLISTICLKTNSDITPKILHHRVGDILHSYFDNSKAVSKLGWTPSYTLEDGISETINSMLQQ